MGILARRSTSVRAVLAGVASAALTLGLVVAVPTAAHAATDVVVTANTLPNMSVARAQAVGYTTSPATVAADWTTEPSCSVYASSDTSYATALTGSLAAGTYVTHCTGGISTTYSATSYVDGSVTVVAASNVNRVRDYPMDGSVTSLATDSNGTAYMAGTFTKVGTYSPNGAQVSTSRTLSRIMAPLDNGVVSGSAGDGQGGWYLVGTFTSIGGLTRNYAAHLLADGSVDTAWNPNLSGGSATSVVLAGSKVIIGGAFTKANGVDHTKLVAVSTAGSVLSWDPGTINGTVNTLLVAGATLYFGGAFTSVNSTGRGKLAAVALSNASLTSWDPAASGGDVSTMALNSSTLYIGGSFTSVASTNRNRLAAVGTDGTLASWDPNANNTVNTIAISGGDTVWVGGAFTAIGATPTTRYNIANIGTDGTLGTFNRNPSSTILALAVVGSSLYIGGTFAAGSSLGTGTYAYIVCVGTTSPYASTPLATVNGSVSHIGVSGTSLYLSGGFTYASSTSRTGGSGAAIDSSGVLGAWVSGISSGAINAIAVSGSTVYIGGAFTTVSATTRNRAAAITTSGTLVTSWNPNLNGTVKSITVSNSIVYMGGSFTTMGSTPVTRNHAAAMSTAGVAQDWDPNADGDVTALAVDTTTSPTATVYLAGAFSNVGGSSHARVAAVDTSGTLTSWAPDVPAGTASAVAVAGPTVFVGGYGLKVTSAGTASPLIALSAATAGESFTKTVNATINALAVSGTTLYGVGDFGLVGGVTRTRAFAMSSAGVLSSWTASLDASGSALAVASGKVYAGGTFTTLGGRASSRFGTVPAQGWVTASSATISAAAAAPSVSYTASPSMVAGDWTTTPTCAVYASSDTTYTTALSGTLSAGTYVTRCTGGVAKNGITLDYVNGTLTVTRIDTAVTAASPTSIGYGTAIPPIGYTTVPSTVAADWTAEPSCAVYESTDTSFATPLSGSSVAQGTYVTHCSGGTATNYNPTSYADGSLVIEAAGPSTPTITTAPSASGITYGSALSASTLTGGVASVAGSFAWTVPTTTPQAGSQSYEVTFTPDDTVSYTTATVMVDVEVAKATTTIDAAPSAAGITYGDPLSSSTLSNGVGSVPGSFGWSAPATKPNAGTTSYEVTFTPDDTGNYEPSTVDVSVTTSKADPSITLAPTAGGLSYRETLASSILSGGTADVDGMFDWTDSTVEPDAGTESFEVTFTPNDTDNYNSATVDVSVTTSKADPSITTPPTASGITYGDALSASLLSGGVGSVDGTFAWTDGTVKPGVGSSSQSVTFTPTDSSNYATATTSVSVTVSAAKVTPTITTKPTATGITYGQTLLSSILSAGAASVPGTFDWTTPSTAPNAGTTSYEVTFTPTDTANYATATTNVEVITAKASTSITTKPSASGITYGDALSASTLSNGVGSVAGSFDWANSAAKPDAGTASYSVTFTPTDAGNYETATTSVSVTTAKASTSITTKPTASGLTYGDALSASSLSNGVGSVAGAFAWTTPGTKPNAGTVSYSVTLTPTDAGNYETATTSVSVTTAKASTSITTKPTASGLTYGDALSASSLSNGVGSVAGSFAWTNPAAKPDAGTASYSVTFTPTDSGNYETATTSVSVTTAKATTTITTAPTASGITSGQALSASTLTGGVGSVAGSFAWTTPSTVPSAGTSSQSVTFTPTDTTNYATAATTVNVTVSAAQTTPTITTKPTASGITYGQTLASSTLTGGAASVPGTFAWTAPSTVPNAGTSSQSVTFTPTDTARYTTATTTVNVAVAKAASTITTAPTSSAIAYGQALSASTLSGGVASTAGTFAWTSPSTVPAVGTSSQSVTFTPASSNYTTATTTVSVTVGKATPTITTAPSSTSVYSTQTLASSLLIGGAASVPGTFAWTTPSTIAPVGTTSQSVTFTPTDTTRYTTATVNVSVTVLAGQPTSIVYTGDEIVTPPTALAVSADVTGPGGCAAPAYALDRNPLTGAETTYSLTVLNGAVATTGWLEGVYQLTASYGGGGTCGLSTDTATLTVAGAGSAASGGGRYTAGTAGRVDFGFSIKKAASGYTGTLRLVNSKKWRLTASLTTYVKTGAKGATTGAGKLEWWNPTLRDGRGGWDLASASVPFTASFSASSPGTKATFGITMTYTPTGAQPSVLPVSTPQPLSKGSVKLA